MRSILAIVNVLGALLAMFAALYLLPALTALHYAEFPEMVSFLACGGATLALGLALLLSTRRSRTELKPRDGYLLVSLSWLTLTASAAVPFGLIEGMSVTDSYFEAMSGLSTTGSSVITGLDALPYSVNLWRHALHWLGGMGIIVLAVAILPLLGVGGMQMYRAETPGPVKDTKLTPRITETAKALYMVYASLTVVCFLALWAAGMTVFDAICHAFSLMSLGGFSTHEASVGYFNSPLIESVFIVCMLVAAVNYSSHFLALRRRDLTVYRRDPEARWVIIWLAASVLVTTALVHAAGLYPDLLTALRHTAFSLISLATTAGFVTEDYSLWPLFVPMWMLFLSCVVPSTGSTGGGLKLIRSLIMIKQWFRELFALVHPHAVIPLKIAGNVVSNRVVNSVLAFVFVYFMTIVILTFTMLATGMDFVTAFTAVLASINNAGPGLGQVGPATNYAALSDFQTWVCILAMFLGRIELFTFLILFTRTFWRK
ncbi:MAG TPA: potassium transporter TrkG [Steroidobacteraceae bacterium]|nr:potassium transporter TrkG [Steroidobacteraceae bacterium]